MKRITTLILVAIISFKLSACAKTKQFIQHGIQQQPGSDTTDYKKLYENECNVSRVRKYINLGLALAVFAAGLVSLHFIDEAVYSARKSTADQFVAFAYINNTPSSLTTDQLVINYKSAIKNEYDFWLLAKPKDKKNAVNRFNLVKELMTADIRVSQNQEVKEAAEQFLNNFNIDIENPKTSWTSKLPFRYLREVCWSWAKTIH